MSLNLYISNDIEKLSAKLADNIKHNPLDLYQREAIVVQTDGMSRWISIKVAEKNKIFSNFEFFSPNKLLFELFRIAGIYNPGLYDTNNLKWIIYDIIGTGEFKSKFFSTYSYFENDKIKQLQLATKLADLFDQYVIYRPDYIRLWNENKSPDIKNQFHEKWQKWVWIKIKEKIGNRAFDKVQMRDALLERFEDRDFASRVKSKFPRISLFGFSLFTLFHIEVFLSALKEIIDVDFYLTNPSPEDYWFKDIKEKTKVKIEDKSNTSAEVLKLTVGNQLLMNQGRTAKDLFNMLFDIDEIFNVMDNETYINPPSEDSLLHIIQNEIYHNTGNGERKPITKELLNDESIQVASNYTAVREVETLYNYLLKQIDENDYKLKDIIVQTTNIDLYTPIIKAVFDNAETKIPYAIADRSYKGNDNLIGILKQLLSLQKDEFTSENILQLLDYDIIRKKFGISNIKTIRTLVKKANIRHGIYGKKENDTLFVSWKYGLEKILLGYAIKSDALMNSPNNGYEIIPLNIAERDYAIEGLRLKSFVDTLIYFVNLRAKPRRLSEWREYIFDFIDSLLEIEDDAINELNYIFDKLSFSDEVTEVLDDKISYEVFFKAFVDSLYENNRNGRFISGQITFCSMIPMRSIPYKVICVLGLNAKTFPRKQSDVSFDLIKSEHRKGDRNLKETDKYLFFETLLSAKERLYLSYLGINIKDNKELPASIVIDELLDYISLKSGTDISKTSLITKHAIDNYDSRYYDKKQPLYYSYLSYGKDNNVNNLIKAEKDKVILKRSISISDIFDFYKNPVKWYFVSVLNINYNEDSILLPESEIFELNRLEKNKLKYEILDNQKTGFHTGDLKKKIISGELPLKNMAKFEVESTVEELEPAIEKLNFIKSNRSPVSIEFEVSLKDSVLYGEIDNVYDNEIILVDLSTDYKKSIVFLKIYSWICSVAELPVDKFTLLYYDKKKAILKTESITPVDNQKSELNLERVVELFIKGNEEILPFMPLASYEYLRKYNGKSGNHSTAYKAFIKILEDKAKYNQYIDKAMEKNVFHEYANQEDGVILRTAKLFFGNEI